MKWRLLLLGSILLISVSNSVFSAETGATNKYKMAVLTFEAIGDSSLDTETLTESFQTELVNIQNKDFTLVERTQLAKIIEEQKLQLSGLTEADAAKVGNLAGASKIIVGKISLYEGKYIINIKGIDTTTAEIVFADKLETADKTGLMDILPDAADRLVKKTKGENVPPYKQEQSGINTTNNKIQPVNPVNSENTPAKVNKPEAWKPASYSAFELGYMFTSVKPQNNSTIQFTNNIYAFKGAFKFPGEGFFQFVIGGDFIAGNLDSETSISMFTLYPSFLWNFITTKYFMLGAGVGYGFSWGNFNYSLTNNSTLYSYPFTQNGFRLNIEAGLHLTRTLVFKLEWGSQRHKKFYIRKYYITL